MGGVHTHVVNYYLSMVEFYERAIVETELRFNRKLLEANVHVDRSEDDGELQASRPRWLECSEWPQIRLTLVADCLGLGYVRYSYYYYFWWEPAWRLLVT